MNIISFRASNMKRLVAVAIDPTGALVRLTGANGSGKSSTLDGIYYALAGVSTIPSNPIRDGAETAEVSLSLGVEGVLKYKVTRKFTRGKTSQVIVESPDGARYASPQALLDRLFGSLTFDPEVFGRMSAKEQLNQLKTLVKLDVDVDALDAQNKADFERRTDVNRQVKQLKRIVDLYASPAQSRHDVEPIHVEALLREIDAAAKAERRHSRPHGRIQPLRRRRFYDNRSRSRASSRRSAQDDGYRADEVEAANEGLRRLRDAIVNPGGAPKRSSAVEVVADMTRQVQDATRENSARDLQRSQREKHRGRRRRLDASRQESEALTARMEEAHDREARRYRPREDAGRRAVYRRRRRSLRRSAMGPGRDRRPDRRRRRNGDGVQPRREDHLHSERLAVGFGAPCARRRPRPKRRAIRSGRKKSTRPAASASTSKTAKSLPSTVSGSRPMPDVSKLPKWARDRIAQLEGTVEHERAKNRPVAQGTSDTWLEHPGEALGKKTFLPNGTWVVFRLKSGETVRVHVRQDDRDQHAGKLDVNSSRTMFIEPRATNSIYINADND
jgi:hypothetical protein